LSPRIFIVLQEKDKPTGGVYLLSPRFAFLSKNFNKKAKPKLCLKNLKLFRASSLLLQHSKIELSDSDYSQT
jgi:hypothetical protein